jgi:uncharacterized cysteine cluster protein YcgN (CxxCxxCC family)
MDDSKSYMDYQNKKWIEHESLCKKCGSCCGIKDGDPCEHLKKSDKNTYYCDIYEDRFGLRKTISGKEIVCVPIRNILHKTWTGKSECGYIELKER